MEKPMSLKQPQSAVIVARERLSSETEDSIEAFIGTRRSDLPSLAYYGQIVWRHRWWASSVFLTTFLIILIGTVRQKPVYLGLGSLEVETPQGSNVESLFEVRPTPDS